VGLWLLLGTDAASEDVRQRQSREQAREHYRAGEELMQQRSLERAAREYEAAIQLDPEYTLAHYSLGQAYMALKRYPSAVEAYLACRETIRARAALDLRKRAELERERDDEIREVQRLLTRWELSGSASPLNTARIEDQLRLLQQERDKGAANRLVIPPELSVALGSACFRSGRLPDAEREYRAAIEVDKKTGSAHNNLAVILMMTGRLEEAEESVRLAEKAGFPVNPRFKQDLKQRLKAQAQ
jgi:Flp pilus assembly protein TadD